MAVLTPGAAPGIEEPEEQTPQEEEDTRETSQDWGVLGIDYSKYDEKPGEETTAPSRQDRLVGKAVRKGKKVIGKKQRTRERFSYYDKDLEGYDGTEMGPTPEESLRNVVNFLIGDDLAITGFEWNQNNFSWTAENAKQTWAEEPVWQNVIRLASLGLNFVPLGAAVNKSMKFGKIGKHILPSKSFKVVGKGAEDVLDLQKQPVKSFRWFEEFPTEAAEKKWLVDQDYLAEGATRKALLGARKSVAARQRANKLGAISTAIAQGKNSFQWGGDRHAITGIDKARAMFDKAFANSYWALSNDKGMTLKKQFAASLNNFYEVENFGRHFANMPTQIKEEGWQKSIHKFMQSGDGAHISGMSNESQTYMRNQLASYRSHQKDWFELGAGYSDEIPDHLQVHIPTQRQLTPAPGVGPRAAKLQVVDKPATAAKVGGGPTKLSVVEMPRLEAPTLHPRKVTELDDILAKIDDGTYISDFEGHALPNFMLDRMLYHNFKFMRDAIEMPGAALSADAVRNLTPASRALYINLNDAKFGGRATLERVLRKSGSDKLGANGELPWVSRSLFDEWMGDAGMMEQAMEAAGVMQAFVAVHKTMKTAGNIPTHATNTIGNMIMQTWNGYKPWTPHNLRVGTQLTKGMHKYAKGIRKAKQAATKSGKEWEKQKVIDSIDIVIPVTNSEGKVVNFQLRDLLNDTDFTRLVEESAFESVEGLARLEQIYEGMNKSTLRGKGLKMFMDLKNAKPIKGGLDNMTEAYLLEDMIPKAQLYVQNIAEGMSKDVALADVARTLPMYNTTGSAIKAGRKVVFPWLTFPAEMTRIMKNQMIDNPMRVLPWMHATNLIQSTGYMGGAVESFEAAEETRRNLPAYGKTPTTVVGKETFTDVLSAGPIGSALGGLAGMAAGKPGLGFAAGAAGGIGLALLENEHFDLENRSADKMRGAVMRWLPHSSLMLQTDAPEIMNQMSGKDFMRAMRERNVGQLVHAVQPGRGFQETAAILPAQPLAIVEPFINMFTGKNSMGQEIKAEDEGAELRKMTAGLIGMMAPPVVQKYGYKQTSPDEQIPVIGRGGAALAGAVAGGVTGYKIGKGPGAVAGALTGAISGGATNVSKLMIDSGVYQDPRTVEDADVVSDLILNTISSTKTYAALPEHRAGNIKMNEAQITEQRTAMKKQASYLMLNHREEEATSYLKKAMTTFERQYPSDPKMAMEKYKEWLENFVDGVGESPLWGGLSKEEMKKELRRTYTTLGDIRSQALREWANGLKAAMRNR
jgi:hypothetical protein